MSSEAVKMVMGFTVFGIVAIFGGIKLIFMYWDGKL